MKTNKIFFAALAAATLFLGSCSDNFLQRDPMGSVITQPQYDKLDDALEGTLRGIYTVMYEVSDHDEFGQRSIDMYGDLLSGDMALTSQTYGWFYQDEYGRTRTSRSGMMWGYYYGMLHNVNLVCKTVHVQSDIAEKWKLYGAPTDGLAVKNSEGDTLYTYTEQEAVTACLYAQALTMRGYIYSGLLRFFIPTTSHLFENGQTLLSYLAFPMYDETNMDSGAQPLAYTIDAYKKVEEDLTLAIGLFGAFEEYRPRASKLEADINVARGLLAYSYLNKAGQGGGKNNVNECMTEALKYANDVINSGAYTILPAADLTTNGFNDFNSKNWIWGQDVTTETAGGLASFWGQVDIHSYSYAWSGDTKVIDKNLYDAIPEWDGRKNWFNDGKKNSSFLLCPDGKFFSAANNQGSTAADDIDREWLSDNVFMRYESMFLIAAEAAYELGDYTASADYLKQLLDNRINVYNPSAAADYATYCTTLSDPTTLFLQIHHNWRVEMWGEGYGLQTFRRLESKYQAAAGAKIKRGSNHLSDGGKEIEYSDETKYTMTIPSSEIDYNPNID